MGNGNSRPALPGLVFAVIDSPTEVQRLDVGNWSGEIIAATANSPAEPVISFDAQWAAYTINDSTIRVENLSDGRTNDYISPYKIVDRLTFNVAGTLVAFTARTDSTSRIGLLDIVNSDFTIAAGAGNKNSRKPLFSTQGNQLVWTQDDGLFSKSLSSGSEYQISPIELVVHSFSPTGKYISTSGGVYDAINPAFFPDLPSGPLYFLDDGDVLSSNASGVRRIDFSGMSNRGLTSLASAESALAVSPDGRYFCWSELGKLSFYDLLLDETITDTSLTLAAGSSITAIYWRLKTTN